MSLSDILHKIIDIRTEQDRQEAHVAVDDADAAAAEAAPVDNPAGDNPDQPAPDASVAEG